MTTYCPPASEITRRVAVGDCSRAQGYDGVPELAASAFEALLAAPWSVSAAAPSMPVHDNGQTSNKTIPAGDAWKCGYGYDAAARTERSACGAACYSFPLPPDALDATNAEGVAAVTSISVRVIGDRYLDAGAVLYAAVTASAEPPPLDSMRSAGARTAAPLCATSSQTGSDGAALPPNRRVGVRVVADLNLSESPLAPPAGAASAWLHLCLALADYTTAREAWIEGGAMLAPDTISVTFGRDVGLDFRGSAAPLSLGRLSSDEDNAQSGPSSRRQDVYVASLPGSLLDTLVDDSADERAAHILAAVLQTPSPLLCSASLSQHSNAAFGIGAASLASTVISRSGLVPAGVWTCMRCEAPFKAPCAAIAHVFAVVGPTAMTAVEVDGADAAPTASVCLDWASVIRRAAFVDSPPSGDVARLSSGLSNGVFSADAAVPFAMRHLGSMRLERDGVYSKIPFSAPLEVETASRELVTVVVQFAPVGPGGGIESVASTTRVLETLSYSNTYTIDAKTAARNESNQSPYLGFNLTPMATTTPSGTVVPSKVEATGGLQPVYVSLLPDGAGASAMFHYAYLPSGSFEAQGHALHWSGQTFYFGQYVGAAHVTPIQKTVIYDSTATPLVNNWIYATIDPSAMKTLTVPVFETVDGAEVPRGSATIRTRYLGGSFNIQGGFVALQINNLFNPGDVEISGDYSDVHSGTLNNGIPQEINIEYYHEITEQTSSVVSNMSFSLPEISLSSR